MSTRPQPQQQYGYDDQPFIGIVGGISDVRDPSKFRLQVNLRPGGRDFLSLVSPKAVLVVPNSLNLVVNPQPAYTNTAQTATVGSEVETVPAGAVQSSISVTDANLRAMQLAIALATNE